jgi:tRNA-2-methylthio-N6-dimethylallyladenosine synthase
MHRGYTAQRYLEKLEMARVAVPDLAVSTDIIVGFPGETEADFAATLEVAAAAQYDYAYTFIYSPRTGTEAAERVDQFIDPAVIGERFDRLRIVAEHSALLKHRARIGRVEEIIVEGPSRKDAALTTGRTRQNKLVHMHAPDVLRPGTYATAEITGAGPHHLMGRFIEVTQEASHKRRLTVTAS